MSTRWGRSSTSCLTGRPPFRGTTALETLEQVKTTEPVPPRGWCRACRATSRRSASSVCKKSRRSAIETAHALGEDLRRFLDGRPIVARRISGAERAWRWCRRNRFVAGTTAVAAAAIVILAVGATVAAFTFRASATRSASAIARRVRTCSNRSRPQARATRFSRQVGQRFESLAPLSRRPGSRATSSCRRSDSIVPRSRRSPASPCPTESVRSSDRPSAGTLCSASIPA